MGIKHIWKIITGKTEATNPAKLTFRNVYAVLQAFFRKKRRNLGGIDLPDALYEQIIWRRTQVMEKSPRCWNEGSCIMCGCEIVGKTMEDRGCEGKCYPEIMPKDKWEKHKKDNDIKLFE